MDYDKSVWVPYPRDVLDGNDESLLMNAAPIFPASPAQPETPAHTAQRVDLYSPLLGQPIGAEDSSFASTSAPAVRPPRSPASPKRAREHSGQATRGSPQSPAQAISRTTGKAGTCSCCDHSGESGQTDSRSGTAYCNAALSCILSSRPILSSTFIPPQFHNFDSTAQGHPDDLAASILEVAPTDRAESSTADSPAAEEPSFGSKPDSAPMETINAHQATSDSCKTVPAPNVRNKALQEALRQAREGRGGRPTAANVAHEPSRMATASDLTGTWEVQKTAAHSADVPPVTMADEQDPRQKSPAGQSFFAALKSRFEPPAVTEATAVKSAGRLSQSATRVSLPLGISDAQELVVPAAADSQQPVARPSSSSEEATFDSESPIPPSPVQGPVASASPRSPHTSSSAHTVQDTPAFQRRMQREFEKLAETIGEPILSSAVEEDDPEVDAEPSIVGAHRQSHRADESIPADQSSCSDVTPQEIQFSTAGCNTEAAPLVSEQDSSAASQPAAPQVSPVIELSEDVDRRPGAWEQGQPTPPVSEARRDTALAGRIVVGRLAQQGASRKVKALTVPVAPAFGRPVNRAIRPSATTYAAAPVTKMSNSNTRPTAAFASAPARRPLAAISRQPVVEKKPVIGQSGKPLKPLLFDRVPTVKTRTVSSRPAPTPAPIAVAAARPACARVVPASGKSLGVTKRQAPSTSRTSAASAMPNPFLVEPIARKPSSVVQIPDFAAAHRAAEAKRLRKLAEGKSKLTQIEAGKTPGRTSRLRMQERAAYDAQNEDYHRRREAARQAFLAEQEAQKLAEEKAWREEHGFKAHPVPEYLHKS